MITSWTCHICGKERPDCYISVRKSDTGIKLGFPVGTMMQNVRYCNDNPKCVEESKVFSFFK